MWRLDEQSTTPSLPLNLSVKAAEGVGQGRRGEKTERRKRRSPLDAGCVVHHRLTRRQPGQWRVATELTTRLRLKNVALTQRGTQSQRKPPDGCSRLQHGRRRCSSLSRRDGINQGERGKRLGRFLPGLLHPSFLHSPCAFNTLHQPSHVFCVCLR